MVEYGPVANSAEAVPCQSRSGPLISKHDVSRDHLLDQGITVTKMRAHNGLVKTSGNNVVQAGAMNGAVTEDEVRPPGMRSIGNGARTADVLAARRQVLQTFCGSCTQLGGRVVPVQNGESDDRPIATGTDRYELIEAWSAARLVEVAAVLDKRLEEVLLTKHENVVETLRANVHKKSTRGFRSHAAHARACHAPFLSLSPTATTP
jgi:hypothetical protein